MIKITEEAFKKFIAMADVGQEMSAIRFVVVSEMSSIRVKFLIIFDIKQNILHESFLIEIGRNPRQRLFKK